MQHVQRQEGERYADGFAEYGSFYGGPTFTYLAPAKSATSAVQELPAGSHLDTTIAVVAKDRNTNREAEGLQPLSSQSNHGSPQLYASGYSVQSQHQRPRTGPNAPAPLNYIHKAPGAGSFVYRFPEAPSSPVSQQHLDHGYSSSQFSAPQPLQFLKRSSTMPPTPPMSFGSTASNDDLLSDRMQSMYVSDQYREVHDYPLALPRLGSATLARMNTISSMGSGGGASHVSSPTQSIPTSPFGQVDRFSIALSTLSSQNEEITEMSPDAARAEIMRRLGTKEDPSTLKGSTSAVKKGFSLRRTNTAAKASNTTSQDTLTDMLEEVASEGNLSLVQAVIALGADPIYRSAGKLKKVKHDALKNASLNGRARVVDYLLQNGASYGDAQKKSTYTPVDRALLGAVYKAHAELATCLILKHDANSNVEQWPREMYDTQHYWAESQVRLSKTSVLDGISKWKNIDQGMSFLKIVMQQPNFDPTTLVSGVFDTKSELQTAEFNYRPWHTTYEYSALSCFVRAGWAEAVEDMLGLKGSPKDYEREDEVLQYQDKVNRRISPINALSKETWENRQDDALRILRLLIDRNFNIGLVQRTATDLGQRTALGRALSADAAQGVELILQNKPGLVREEIYFRRNKKETKALPLAAALSLEAMETARVLLRAGAHPRDPAFEGLNVLQSAASQGGEVGSAMVAEMIGLAPELTYDALDIAIRCMHKDVVRVLLDFISAAALREQIAALPPIYDVLLQCEDTDRDSSTRNKYFELIDMVYVWDAGAALQKPQLPVILSAIRKNNYVGMEKLLRLGIVDGKSLVLNNKAQPLGEQGLWTTLECCEMTNRANEWLGLFRYFGAPLYQ